MKYLVRDIALVVKLSGMGLLASVLIVEETPWLVVCGFCGAIMLAVGIVAYEVAAGEIAYERLKKEIEDKNKRIVKAVERLKNED